MKNLFAWRLPLSQEDFLTLWKTATFVFDSNFLLNLYRVSPSTADNFIKVLEKNQDRIWIPYQVAYEFLENKDRVRSNEQKSFENAISKLKEWKLEQKQFKALRGFFKSSSSRILAPKLEPLLSERKDYEIAIDALEQELLVKIEEIKLEHLSEEDWILEKILCLFDSRTGSPLPPDRLQELYREAEERYKLSKPPGFRDQEKEEHKKYGDFIIWRSILDFSKENSTPIIFVTGDRKEDWWKKKNGEIISPHPELRREFQEYVQQLFWMYPLDCFLKRAMEQLEIDITSAALQEARESVNLNDTDLQENTTTVNFLPNLTLPLADSIEPRLSYSSKIAKPSELELSHSLAEMKKQISLISQSIKAQLEREQLMISNLCKIEGLAVPNIQKLAVPVVGLSYDEMKRQINREYQTIREQLEREQQRYPLISNLINEAIRLQNKSYL